MHELAITRNIVAIVEGAAKGRKVNCITLQIGCLSGVMGAAVETCFGLIIEGTPLAGARLLIDRIEGRGLCGGCGAEFAMPDLFHICPCGGRAAKRLRGEELTVKSVEFEDA